MAVVSINGPIVSSNDQPIYDWMGMDATSPRSVQEQIDKAKGGTLEVLINSGGGSVFAGSEIYTTLMEYKNTVTVKVIGIAASAASVIAMAGDEILMSPTSQLMIHNSTGYSQGDYRVMDHTSNVLKNINETIANAYVIKTGLDRKELLRLMDKETWFTPEQALNLNLIDAILFQTPKEKAQNSLEQLKSKRVEG
jgi:ATP-dependent Clp protease, protease subunit